MNFDDKASRCPQCSGESRFLFAVQDLNHKISDEVFSYRACTVCELTFLFPVPANLGRYYPKGYHAIPRKVGDLEGALAAERHKVDLVQHFSAGTKLLEIGPSFGAFCLLAKRSGYDVAAVEMDPECCRFLRDSVGITVHEEADVAAFLQSSGSFDAICLWHSLEHLPDPWSVLDGLRKSIRKGGALYISTPNPNSLQFQLFGRYWLHLDAPRHVQLIPYTTLKARLEARGYRSEYITTKDKGGRDCDAAGWRVSPNHLLGVKKENRWIQQVGRNFGRLVYPLESKEGRGAAYTAVFRPSVDS
jgi:2-polyprenyl-3-methyl-5-hydroxy-6-metoxy-1,4-benzoquinol methylase